MDKSIFEKIIDREVPADIVYENDEVISFKDIAAQAPTHLLVIPKKRFNRIDLVPEEEAEIFTALFKAVQVITREAGVHETGYRIVINNGKQAGETVPHLHVHILAGRDLEWPPG